MKIFDLNNVKESLKDFTVFRRSIQALTTFTENIRKIFPEDCFESDLLKIHDDILSVYGDHSIIINDGDSIEVKSFFYYQDKSIKTVRCFYENMNGEVFDLLGGNELKLNKFAKEHDPNNWHYSKSYNYYSATTPDIKRRLSFHHKINSSLRALSRSVYQSMFYKFTKSLDPEARFLMNRTHCHLNQFYNWLMVADKTHRLYRRQFAQVYPSAINVIFSCHQDTRHTFLFNAIDTGKSPIIHLTKFVSNYLSPALEKSVDFCMKKAPQNYFGTHYQVTPEHLAITLSFVNKNFWPKSKKEFHYFSVIAKQYNFGTNGEQHFEKLAKNCNVVKNGWDQFASHFKNPTELGNYINDYHQDIVPVVRELHSALGIESASMFTSLIAELDNTYHPKKKKEFVDYYHANYNRVVEEYYTFYREREITLGKTEIEPTVFKLDIEKFKSDNEHVTINQLILEDDFRIEGKRMKHCVGGYYYTSLSGTRAIFSIKTSKGRSTLELRLCANEKNGSWVEENQHRKENNLVPHQLNKQVATNLIKFLKGSQTIISSIEHGSKFDRLEAKKSYANKERKIFENVFVLNKIFYPFFKKREGEFFSIKQIEEILAAKKAENERPRLQNAA